MTDRRAIKREYLPVGMAEEYAGAHRLAAELAKDPALLALSTKRLVLDIMETRGVCKTYAYRAVGFARKL